MPGDFLILCSDGLTDLVDKEEIKSALLTTDREKALQDLTQLANQRGGHDNITIVVLEVPKSDVKTKISQVHHRPPRKQYFTLIGLLVLAVVAFALVAAVIAGIWLLSSNTANPTPTPTVSPTSLFLPALSTRTPAPLTETSTPVAATSVPDTLTPWPTNTLTNTLLYLVSPTLTPPPP
jgi:hypothetical protein